MGRRDPRIDAYIAKAAPFAQPILRRLRELVHEGCPEVVETIKWSSPHFDYRGIFAGMAAFKRHATFGFWKGSQLFKTGKEREAMGQFGRLGALSDLPPDEEILDYVRAAAKLNESRAKLKPKLKHPKKPIPVPDDLKAGLAKSAKARKTFTAFSPSHQREYLEWITEAKTAPTRARRLATTLEWLAEGRSRNWKYQAAKVARRAKR